MIPNMRENGYEWIARKVEPMTKEEKANRKLSQPYTTPEQLERITRMRKIRVLLKKENVSAETKEKLLLELQTLSKRKR